MATQFQLNKKLPRVLHPVSLRIPVDLFEAMRAHCEAYGITQTYAIAQALDAWLAADTKRRGKKGGRK